MSEKKSKETTEKVNVDNYDLVLSERDHGWVAEAENSDSNWHGAFSHREDLIDNLVDDLRDYLEFHLDVPECDFAQYRYRMDVSLQRLKDIQ